jgi:programmed cell death protein 5
MMQHQPTPEEIQQVELMKKTMMRKLLSRGAIDRLSRIKMVKPDIAAQLEMYLLDLYKSGKIKSEVSEEQMKMILETISGTNRPGSIKVIRK